MKSIVKNVVKSLKICLGFVGGHRFKNTRGTPSLFKKLHENKGIGDRE